MMLFTDLKVDLVRHYDGGCVTNYERCLVIFCRLKVCREEDSLIPSAVQQLISDNDSGRVEASYTLLRRWFVSRFGAADFGIKLSFQDTFSNQRKKALKQIFQSLRTGITQVADVPIPGTSRGSLLIRTSQTLVSAGTERMLVEFGKAGWIDKARQQPDKVRMVLDKIKTDGLQANFGSGVQ